MSKTSKKYRAKNAIKESGKVIGEFEDENGQTVRGNFIPFGSDYILVSKSALERRRYFHELLDQRQAQYRGNTHWVRCFQSAIRTLSQTLTTEQAGALLKLVPYLHMKSQGRLDQPGKPGHPLSQSDIEQILRRKSTATRNILNALVKRGVLRVERQKTNVYFVSQNYHMMGKDDGKKKFIQLHTNKARKMFTNIDLNEACMLYKLMPYLHRQSFHLCHNMNEDLRPQEGYEFNSTAFGKYHAEGKTLPISYLTQQDIVNILGVDRKTVYHWTKKLVDARLLYQDPSDNSYLMRPDVFSRLDVGIDPYARRLVSMIDDPSLRGPHVAIQLAKSLTHLVCTVVHGKELLNKPAWQEKLDLTYYDLSVGIWGEDFFTDILPSRFNIPSDVKVHYVYTDGSPANIKALDL